MTTAVLLQALDNCRVHVRGPLQHTGTNASGDALTAYPVEIYPARSFFKAERRVAEMLILQRLAEETTGPDYLRPLLSVALEAASALEAAFAVLSAPAPQSAAVLVRTAVGLNAYRLVKSTEDANRVFDGEFPANPIFRVEQIVSAGRLVRHFEWHAGAMFESPTL